MAAAIPERSSRADARATGSSADARAKGSRAGARATGSLGEHKLLLAALLVLAAVFWIEPRGSGLAEPDETRYAEIPREMLAAHDLVAPRLNGVPYFEKPPLLYWANAAAFRVSDFTPWAARLPTRLAGLGTVLLLVLAASRAWGRETGLCAGVLYLASPIGFLASRTNLTDGLLTFFFTATVLAGREAIQRRARGRPWMAMAACTGACAAGAFLTKGLVALALPGAILLLWCWATGSGRQFLALVLSPALPVFLALSLPWLILAERRHPGFLQFFFIHEHFARFATGAAKRPGPLLYFVPVFLLGFLPGVPFFFAGAARVRRSEADGLLYLVWFATVFVFFSVSRSKLPPYLFPAMPAAAALAARGVSRGRGIWIAHAALATAFAAALLLHPAVRAQIVALRLAALVAPALAALVLASWAAVLFAARSSAMAAAALGAGWAACLLGVVLGWPRIPQASETAVLAAAAQREALSRRAPIVAYRAYLNGVSWELRRPIPVADYRGELEPDFESNPE
ncbi:MAG TPA: glycosyltransferase family 39 protein, partial [Vicinamibacteria bacterium]|nr:glycosyltransferase family 39 protein [Vicinamibacteria bacterium]